MDKKLNKERLKRTTPAYVFNETQKAIIEEHIPYKLTSVIIGGKKLACVEFQEDVFNILDDIESYQITESLSLTEAESTAELRGVATRISTLAFQCIRELQYINGNSLIDIANSIRVTARVVALAVVTGLANIDIVMARRILPLIRTI